MTDGLTISRRHLLGFGAAMTGGMLLQAGAGQAVEAPNAGDPYVTVGSGEGLGHVRIGTGPVPVAVLHQWLGDHRMYDEAVRFLPRDKFTFYLADLRGYGLSKSIKGSFSAAEAASDVTQLMTGRGHDRFYVLAHSMSGMIAQYLTVTVPDRILGVVAVSPVPAAGFRPDAAALADLRAVITDDAAAAKAIQSRTGKRYSDAWVNWKLRLSRSSATAEAMAGYLAMFTGTSFADEVAARQPAMPVAVLTGEFDVPTYRHDTVEKTMRPLYPHLTMFPENREAGHYPMLETPALFASEVDKALGVMISG